MISTTDIIASDEFQRETFAECKLLTERYILECWINNDNFFYASVASEKRDTKFILIMYINSLCATYVKSEYNDFIFLYDINV